MDIPIKIVKMVWKCKYFAILLTFLIFNRAVSSPTKEKKLECEVISDFYPPKLSFDNILRICDNQLQNPFLDYCDELFRVRNETSSCELGGLLNNVPTNIRENIIKTSLAFPMIKDQSICDVFKKLNNSLYDVYLDKPGFGKQLAGGVFCTMFCKKDNYCEMLLRTYWIKKVLLDVAQDLIKAQQGVANISDPMKKGKSAKENTDLEKQEHSTISSFQQANKQSRAQSKKNFISGLSAETVTPVIVVDKPKKSKARTESIATTISTVGQNKVPEIHVTTLAMLSLKPQINENKNVKADQSRQKETTKVPDKQNINNSPNEEKPNDISKSRNDQDLTEDPKLKVNSIDIDQLTDATEAKENQPDSVTQLKKNDNTKEINNMDGQIQVTQDKVIGDDTATTMEKKDTEFGNQIRDFGDGYAEQINEYQDGGPQDEPEAPLPAETVQPDSNNIDNNLKSDETNPGKQVHDVPQISAFPEEEDGHFFAYFLTIVVFCIAGYLVFHNKQKIIALIIEGRHERRRRPNNGTYKRLDSKDGAKATSNVIF